MWLRDSYYKLESRQEAEGRTVFHIRLLSDCAVYKGHFPNKPVCPGVFHIQTIKECAEEVAGKKLSIAAISRCRLTAVATPTESPEMDVTVEMSESESGFDIVAKMTDANHVYVEYKGTMRISKADEV